MDSWLAQLALLQGPPAYALLFALLFGCGIGAPMNEDIVLLVAAALTLSGVMDPLQLIVVAWFGLVLGDALVFFWGHRFGPRICATRWVPRIVSPDRLKEFQDRVRRGGPGYIFVIRFMPGIRTALFFAAGTLKLRYRTLFFFDGAAAAIELPLLVYGVRFVGGRWQQILEVITQFQIWLLAVLALLIVAFLVRRWLRRGADNVKHLPHTGREPQDVLRELRGYAADDPNYRDGRLWGLVYYLDDDYSAFLGQAYAAFSSANGLNPTAFKSLKRFENVITAATAELLDGTPEVCGVVTSGGTESCLLAVKTYRDLARATRRVTKPEMIVPQSAHVAWFKASEYFGVKLRCR